MLGSTLVLPLSTGNATLVKINQDGYASEYLLKEATREITARIRHTKTKASADRPAYDRHNVEIVETVYASGEVAEFQRKFYFVWEKLPSDTSVVIPDGVCDLAIATSDAFLTSLHGWES